MNRDRQSFPTTRDDFGFFFWPFLLLVMTLSDILLVTTQPPPQRLCGSWLPNAKDAPPPKKTVRATSLRAIDAIQLVSASSIVVNEHVSPLLFAASPLASVDQPQLLLKLLDLP